MLKHYLQAQAWLQGPPRSAGDFSRWFDVLSNGQGAWRYDEIPQKPLRDLFERMATRLEIPGNEISREQFLRYAQHFLMEGTSPSWKSPEESGPLAEATKTFRDLDRNGDGLLNIDEMSDILRAERDHWDANRDGFIELNEYLAYFQGRMRHVVAEQGGSLPLGGKGNSFLPSDQDDRKPVVWRADKLPPGLPAWFTQLDTDRDAQLGLYEWKFSGRPLGEFDAMDRNGDGFLTVTELVRFLKLQEQDKGGPSSGSLVSAGGSWRGTSGLPNEPKPKDPNKLAKGPKPKDPNKPPKEPKSKGPPDGGLGRSEMERNAWPQRPEPIGYPR